MTFALPQEVTVAESENGLVLLDQRNGRYWQLNATGAAVLRLLLDGYSPTAAAARVGRDYPEASERVRDDVLNLLDALREAGLIVLGPDDLVTGA
jgi:hypothetical protein